MKTYILLILALLFSCVSPTENPERTSSEIIESEKLEAFKGLLQTFDSFIESNYSGNKNLKDKYVEFLTDFKDFYTENKGTQFPNPVTKWSFNLKEIIAMNDPMESSLMRHEIKLYPHEPYPVSSGENAEFKKEERKFRNIRDSLYHARTDSIMTPNLLGKYIEMLFEDYEKDKCVKLVVDARLQANRISPIIVADGGIHLLTKESCPNINFIRTFVAVDYYYELVDLIAKKAREKQLLTTGDTP